MEAQAIKKDQEVVENKPQGRVWKKFALGAIALSWALILGFNFRAQPSLQNSSKSSDSRQKVLNKINHYLQFADKKSELDQMRVEVQNHEESEPISSADQAKVEKVNLGSLSAYRPVAPETNAKSVYEDLHGPANSFEAPLTPRDRIEASLARREWVSDYQRHQANEYVEQFVANAKAQGYEVKLNDQMEVVEIQAIPREKRFKGLTTIQNQMGY
ncbi:MAG: hypothetical protein KDD22_01615 [Bdellovibrionales bacterium]|nr:hypothetical protein [Bdellovibrionales bacterium]